MSNTLTLRRAVLLMICVDALALWPFTYWHYFGHGDLRAMQMGLYAPDRASLPIYGRSWSFAWYWLATVLRSVFSLSADAFPGVINTLAVLAATAGDAFLLILLGLALPVPAALLATVLWRFTPEVWEVNTYAHPWTLAQPIFLGAMLLVVGRPRSRAATALAGVLFFLSFGVRADVLLFVPLALALAYLRRPDWLRPLAWSLGGGTAAFLVSQQIISGSQLARAAAGASGGSIDLLKWAINLAVFGYGAGLLTVAATLAGVAYALRVPTLRRAVLVVSIALLPTVALWLPHGGAGRHFSTVYLAMVVLVALGATTMFRTTTWRTAVALFLVLGNAAAAEVVYAAATRRPSGSIQIGEARRVLERVPFGNIWSNHYAETRLNGLESAFAEYAVRCAEQAPIFVAQESPYKLVMLAGLRLSAPRLESLDLYKVDTGAHQLWIADIPEDGSAAWWQRTEARANALGLPVVILGPRIPGWLGYAWRQQHPELASPLAETIASIQGRACPSPASGVHP